MATRHPLAEEVEIELVPLDMGSELQQVICYTPLPTTSSDDNDDNGDYRPSSLSPVWKIQYPGASGPVEPTSLLGAISATPSGINITTSAKPTSIESSSMASAQAKTRSILGISMLIDADKSYDRGEGRLVASPRHKSVENSGWSRLRALWKKRKKDIVASCEEYEMEDLRML